MKWTKEGSVVVYRDQGFQEIGFLLVGFCNNGYVYVVAVHFGTLLSNW